MNRQRLVAALTAGLTATAVLAGVVGLLSGDLHMSFSRTWADGVPAAAQLAKAQLAKAQHAKPSTSSRRPTASKPGKQGRPTAVVTHGRTWT